MSWFKEKKVITDEGRIEEVLTRGIENIFPNKEFIKSKFLKGEKLSFYLGVDPTSSSLHLGHAMPLKKLGDLQKLGHKIIFLVGDFTAMIGDPTDKTATRKKLTREQVLTNCREYKKQASKFISFSGDNKAEMRFNSEWLSSMSFEDVLELSSHMTVNQMLKRDMFARRIQDDKPLFIHEFMYPLMQGYDSVALDVDGEIGGNDQTFNMLAGRDFMKDFKNKEKSVIAMKLLTDSSGKKMGKTDGNAVSLDQTPEDMFGRVMSWSDDLILPGFELITSKTLAEIEEIKGRIAQGENPRNLKALLAFSLVELIHNTESAVHAQEAFENTFKKGEVPEDVPVVRGEKGGLIKDIVVKEGIVSSNAEWRRLVESKAVSHVGSDEVITDPYAKIEQTITIRVGKKRFIKIEV